LARRVAYAATHRDRLCLPAGRAHRARGARRAHGRGGNRRGDHPMHYWLMKSEPSTFGLEHLAAAPRRTTAWDGVRNYQARNMLRDEMKKGDQAFLYYSSTEAPGIVAIMQVVREGYPDPTAFDRKNHHYDAGSDPQNPRWFMVDVQ